VVIGATYMKSGFGAINEVKYLLNHFVTVNKTS